ncbi:MAG: hypothetical protein IPI59_01055 [Sphingobacteriales bacterium]|jgi:hypothetical protein|nr:hypothetical protein [Sphingobacteriales bacterium]MBP9142229.1 hypothetical protein [Chitinophagales bacterium]MDA0199132.1 hypothetical protein [Bacteroidota bacterium]MBK7526159.1 hypothetical protein [Sphingobacteriales bacterium]MBK8677875.1 hypothetical protein [Sphingobacteriales bacterium]
MPFFNQFYKKVFLLGLGVLFIFSGCDPTATTDDTCTLSLKSVTINPSTVAAGGDVSATLTLSGTALTNANDNVIKSSISVYLDKDGNLNTNSDPQLDAFAPGAISGSGQLFFDQIVIPFGTSSGSYSLTFVLEPVSCGSGNLSSSDKISKNVTVN